MPFYTDLQYEEKDVFLKKVIYQLNILEVYGAEKGKQDYIHASIYIYLQNSCVNITASPLYIDDHFNVQVLDWKLFYLQQMKCKIKTSDISIIQHYKEINYILYWTGVFKIVHVR